MERAVENLVSRLPEDMPEVEEEGFGEDILRDENGRKKDEIDFENIDIEDI